jgi:hypothetical protein
MEIVQPDSGRQYLVLQKFLSMRYDYVVTLKKSSDRQIDLISIFLCFFSALAFIFEQVRAAHFNFFLSLAALIITTFSFYNIVSAKKGNIVRYKNWLFVAGICWIGMPYLQWVSIIFFFLAFLEYQAKHPLEVGFTNEQVIINTLIKRKFIWADFNNIILKDGLLTLDFRNNKIFQKETLDDDEPDADEDEFNDYCRMQLMKANNKSTIPNTQQLKTEN